MVHKDLSEARSRVTDLPPSMLGTFRSLGVVESKEIDCEAFRITNAIFRQLVDAKKRVFLLTETRFFTINWVVSWQSDHPTLE